MPETPTSTRRSTCAPTNPAVTAASSATGRSVVPAQTTATVPSSFRSAPGAFAWNVREIGSYRPWGAAASAATAASGDRRVTRTACPSSCNRETSFPICSGVLRSPKMTSGAPCRTARSPSSWAKSAIRCTGSAASFCAASATDNSPRFTRSRRSVSPCRSTPPIYLRGVEKAWGGVTRRRGA